MVIRTPDRPLRVFVSSTLGELAEERRAVSREQALRYWREYQRAPHARRWDRPGSCGEWECCPDIEEVRAVLTTVVHNLPKPDARGLRSGIATSGEDPFELPGFT